jgi:hypothetical protein
LKGRLDFGKASPQGGRPGYAFLLFKVYHGGAESDRNPRTLRTSCHLTALPGFVWEI